MRNEFMGIIVAQMYGSNEKQPNTTKQILRGLRVSDDTENYFRVLKRKGRQQQQQQKKAKK